MQLHRTNELLKKHLWTALWCAVMLTLIFISLITDWKV